MAQLSKEQLLDRVKNARGITGDYMDARLEGYIEDAQHYMQAGGVRASLLNDTRAAGAIVRYVSDMLDGDGTVSNFVDKRIAQLELEPEEEGDANVQPEKAI